MIATSAKKSVNLTVNDPLVVEAKALEINMSREFEIHLAPLVRQLKKGWPKILMPWMPTMLILSRTACSAMD